MVVAQLAKNVQQINVWECNWSMDLKIMHKSEYVLDASTEADTNVIGTFCSDGTIFLAQSNGIWHVSWFTIILTAFKRNRTTRFTLFF